MGMEWDSDGVPFGNVRVCDKSPFSVMISLEKMDVYGSYGRSPCGYYFFPSKSGWWFETSRFNDG